MNIKFHLVREWEDLDIPSPFPASKGVPSWMKHLTPEAEREDYQTVKRCIPFLDAMTAGYIIPLPFDLTIAITPTGNQLLWKSEEEKDRLSKYTIVESHDSSQYPGAPFSQFKVIKFYNPWIVETSPNTSCMFVPPLNRPELPYVPLSGIVDTDQYFNTVNLPCVFPGLDVGHQINLKMGTPMIQVIPFKRQEWKSSITNLKEGVLTRAHETREDMRNDRKEWYRRKKWQKKSYR
tara:strand:- start:2589 stop:3293 length:705 start_codon:yes stop_codon:yes gene_type:complete